MEKMRKGFKWLLLASLVFVLVGCSNGGDKESSTGKSKSSGKTEITYAIWDTNQEKGMQEMAKKFEESNSDIKVNVEVTPWDQYWTKLDAAATGASLPDVFWMHSNEAYRYMSNGILADLTEAVKDVKMDKLPKNIVELYSYEGSQFAIPKDIDTIGLWYNKTLFDEAGVAYPDDTWTWETFLEAAKKLTNEEKGIYGFTAVNAGQEGYWNNIFQNEGKVMSDDHKTSEFDNPNTIEAIQWYADLINVHKVSPTADQLAENKPTSYIQSGRSAMGFFGSWMLADFKDNEYMVENTDVAVLPQGKTRASIYNGLGNAVAANSKNQEAAIKFVQFLGSEEANLISAEVGSAIPAYEGTAAKWVDSAPGFNVQAYIDMLDYAVLIPFSNETIKVETIQTEALNDVFAGKRKASEVAKEIKEQVNEVLK